MLKFLNLTLRNFMSYGNNTTVFDLDRNKSTLIIGENGTGKSCLINGLAYALYGKPASKISLENLINNINKKNMEVSVTFEKNGTYYHIRRGKKTRGQAGNYIKYYVKEGSADFEESDERARDGIREQNKVIEKVLGVSHDIFCRIVVFSATNRPFLDLPARHPTQECQTRFIEELFDLTSLSEKAELLKQEIKDNERELRTKTQMLEQIKKEHERHNALIKNEETRVSSWEQQNKRQVADLKAKLEKLSSVNVEEQRQIHDDIAKLELDVNDIKDEERALQNALKQLSIKKNKLTKELSHLQDDKCPYCLQKYPNAEEKINEVEKEISEKQEKIDTLVVETEGIQNELAPMEKRLKELKEMSTVSNIEELIQLSEQASSIEERINELKKQNNPFVESLKELQNTELDSVDDKEIKHLKKVIEHQKLLNQLLTKKDSFVRKSLLHRNIPYLNMRLQTYLNDLGLPHTVEFTHELSAKITQFGRELDFGNLSNGQRARVNLALSLAFRDVLQSMHQKVNVCMFDEVLDVGLSSTGVQAAARLLKRIARDEKNSIYIISHRDEIDSAFDSRLSISLSGGFSYIVQEE